MKKVFILFCLIFSAGLMSAQCTKSASKACCAKKSAETTAVESNINVNETQVASMVAEAEAVAATDESIEVRKCEQTHTTSFYKKSVCPMSGKISSAEVKFDPATKTFVSSESSVMNATMESNAAPESDSEVKPACNKPCAKTCTKGKS